MPRIEYRLIAGCIALEHGAVVARWAKRSVTLPHGRTSAGYIAFCEDAHNAVTGLITLTPDGRGLYTCAWLPRKAQQQ